MTKQSQKLQLVEPRHCLMIENDLEKFTFIEDRLEDIIAGQMEIDDLLLSTEVIVKALALYNEYLSACIRDLDPKMYKSHIDGWKLMIDTLNKHPNSPKVLSLKRKRIKKDE